MLLATTLQSHTEAMPGLPSLGEKRWAHPLPLATIPPGAWHRYTPPCLCAPWHPSHGLICHSLTLAPSTGLAHGRQLSGPGQHLSPLPFSRINGVLSFVRDINIIYISRRFLSQKSNKATNENYFWHRSVVKYVYFRPWINVLSVFTL